MQIYTNLNVTNRHITRECDISIYGKLTIREKFSLTVEGNLFIPDPDFIRIEGKLIVKGNLFIGLSGYPIHSIGSITVNGDFFSFTEFTDMNNVRINGKIIYYPSLDILNKQ